MTSRQKFYLSTPIYYVNARPHLGHAYTTILCDAVARQHRMLGDETFFLTGTDEHGQKIERSAAAAGKTPQQLTDEVAAQYRALWDRMGIRYDGFIRTTELAHARGVQEIFRRIQKNGFIYKARYTGQYCVSCELFVSEGGPGTPCPDCGRLTETISEENYYFKLSAFEDRLLAHVQDHPDFVFPETRRNEVLSFVRGGLKDLSISRTTVKWGIPVPNDPAHVLYVWFDAVCNYATAVGFGDPAPGAQARYEKLWPADVHMIGKEIVRFHAVYWPAFLLAAGLPLPKQIVVHGWLLFEESKMSKTRGNMVRAETVLDVLGGDALRYYLMREIAFGQDGSFSFDALVQRYDSDLANGLGNLSSRTLTMIQRYFDAQIPLPSLPATTEKEQEIVRLASEVIKSYQSQFANYQFSRALETAWTLVAAVNKYIVETEPWVVAEKKDETSRARLATVLYTAAEALRIVTVLVHPVIPDSTIRIWAQLGMKHLEAVDLRALKWGDLACGTPLGKIEAVFPRAESDAVERMKAMEDDNNPPAIVPPAVNSPATTAPAVQPAPAADGKISIDDFAKVELRVGLVKSAEKVKGADRLLRLEVDIGTEVRQIVAGIALAYAPEALVGRKVVIVANLAPRKLRGLESNGMIVAAKAGEQGLPVLAGFLEDVPVGARLK